MILIHDLLDVQKNKEKTVNSRKKNPDLTVFLFKLINLEG